MNQREVSPYRIVLLATALFSSNLPANASPAEPVRPVPLLLKPATVADVSMVYLSHQLAQFAFSEYDSLKRRDRGTRFIPQEINAYYLDEPTGQNIHIQTRYRHSEKTMTEAQAKERCQAMIRWVRFHLGVKDSGVPMMSINDYGTSDLYQYILGDELAEKTAKETAAALDAQVMIYGDVVYVDGPGPFAMCKAPLLEKNP